MRSGGGGEYSMEKIEYARNDEGTKGGIAADVSILKRAYMYAIICFIFICVIPGLAPFDLQKSR